MTELNGSPFGQAYGVEFHVLVNTNYTILDLKHSATPQPE